MKLTIEHADGKKEVDELNTGETFIDYNSRDEVPGSKRAAGVTKQWHVRYFSVPVNERSPITKLVLESYRNGISATTLAITADNEPPKPMPKFSTAAAAAPAPKKETELPKSGETLPAKAEAGTIRALLVGGGSSHDFEKFFHQADSATLKAAGKIVTAYTSNAEEALALLKNADVLVLSANHPSFGTQDFQHALNAFADAGHGVVIVHAGVWYNWPPATGYNKRFVGGGAKGHGKGEFTVYNKAPKHPVMEGVRAEFKITDEHYRVILDEGAPVEVLAETEVEKATDQAYPSVWVSKDPKAKFLNIALGHDNASHSNPAYQKILVNAVRWVAGK
jgi:type 1 glutamine amidotransferase